jgi:hypothetical protein
LLKFGGNFVKPALQQNSNPGSSEGRPIAELGLTTEQIEDLSHQFQAFKKGWAIPGMEAYDNL